MGKEGCCFGDRKGLMDILGVQNVSPADRGIACLGLGWEKWDDKLD